MAHRAAIALLCLGLLPGCFLTRNQAASAEYARQVMVASTRVAVLEEQLAEAGARVESLEEAMRAQGATVVTRLENMEQVNAEVGRLRGELEVVRFEPKDEKTRGVLQEIIQETTNHINRMQVQRSATEVEKEKMDSAIAWAEASAAEKSTSVRAPVGSGSPSLGSSHQLPICSALAVS